MGLWKFSCRKLWRFFEVSWIPVLTHLCEKIRFNFKIGVSSEYREKFEKCQVCG